MNDSSTKMVSHDRRNTFATCAWTSRAHAAQKHWKNAKKTWGYNKFMVRKNGHENAPLQVDGAKNKKPQKVRPFTTTAVGRSDPPLKETASSNLQKNPSGETTNSAKSPATASLEVAVEVAGRKPRVLGGNFWPPKISRQSCRFSNPGGVTNIHGPHKTN